MKMSTQLEPFVRLYQYQNLEYHMEIREMCMYVGILSQTFMVIDSINNKKTCSHPT